MDKENRHQAALSALHKESARYQAFMESVVTYFEKSSLRSGEFPAIYALKQRVKSDNHIARKFDKKEKDGIRIDLNNVFGQITDYCGVRIIHMHMGQFETIHNEIIEQIKREDWVFHERPVANFWDPDLAPQYTKLDLELSQRETLYTSVHYLVKPRPDVPMVCEIQVRTLFEEIWGEVDHYLNYPEPNTNAHCRRQLRVLSKMVCSGSRLVDSIFISSEE
jgi:ppGpp synthetase/RelA/SpoT-type nucleotidyltranferase